MGPLVALKEARDRFHRAASEWQNVLQRVLVRGDTPVTSDILQLWNSVRNKLVLAKHNETTKKAGKYSSMSMARSMALFCAACFKSPMLIYDAALHHPMGSGQSKVKSLDTDVGLGADSLDNSVFSLFYLPDVKARMVS